MFGQTPPTPYDIEFNLFGIPVRVHPFFWLIGLVFGWGLQRPDLIVIWMLCLFVSILIHEMGHAIMIRAFGYNPHIVLHQFGGYASFIPGYNYSLWKSVAVSFAGPLAGFMFYGVIIGIESLMLAFNYFPSPQLYFALYQLEWINLYWGLVNLLPVLPLDGGQICRDVLLMFRRDGDLWALRIGGFVGALVATLFLMREDIYPAVLFGFLALSNLKELSDRNMR